MFRYIAMATTLIAGIAVAGNDRPDSTGLIVRQSPYSADETVTRIEQALASKNIPVFAVFDHDKNARNADLDLRPTKIIVFGSPRTGTPLMQENQAIAIELPLKIAVWEEPGNQVKMAYQDMKRIAGKYGLADHPAIGKIQELLENITGGIAGSE